MKAWKPVLIAAIILTSNLFAQLTRDDVREILIIQGEVTQQNLEEQTEAVYSRYNERNSYRTTTLLNAVSLSFSSGFSMGLHQSHTALYNRTEWMPGFMQDWFASRKDVDGVFSLGGQANKVFRDFDYVTDRMAYNEFNRYFGNNWIYTYLSHTLLKNVTAYAVRHRMSQGTWF